MRFRIPFLAGVVLLKLVSSTFGQGFINLNFESATISPSQPPSDFTNPSTWIPIGDALPGWSAFLGTNQFNSVPYSNETIGSANISLLGTNGISDRALEGNFSALLQAGLVDFAVRTEASLRQTGLVPIDAQSIQFKLIHWYVGRPFAVSLDGQTLSLIPLDVTPNYTLYGADITAFAGSTRELRFTAFTPDGGLNNLNLDSIIFSSEIIPEPSVFGLFALGALLLGWRLRQTGA